MTAAARDPASVLMVEGRLLEPGAAALPANIPGILRGEGIFEAFLVEDGVPSPFLPEHARRLEHSARLLGLHLGGAGLEEALPEFLPHVPRGQVRVRYTVLRGLGERLVRFWIAGPPALPPREVVLALSPFRRDPADPLVSAKTTARAGSQRARQLAEAQGAWEALLPTVDGDLAECTACNLFLWRRGVLETPAQDRGILWGVTRSALLRGCRRLGVPVREGRVLPAHLEEADEVFVTNAIIGVIPVREVLPARREFAGASGAFLPRLREAYEVERQAVCAAAVERSQSGG